MTATLYRIGDLRRRRQMLEAEARTQRERERRESIFRRILDGDPDDTPPGGWAA